jgi:hypothetical protein
MHFEYSNLIPADFHLNSRVWIYQSSRLFSISEAFEIEEKLTNYLVNWKTHGTPVKGYANLFFGQFIIIMADESAASVGGCSTDTLFRMIQDLELHYKVSLLNRQNLAFLIKDKVQMLPMSQIKHGIENGFLKPDTLYFNNLAATKKELLNNWIIPIKDSWLSKNFITS